MYPFRIIISLLLLVTIVKTNLLPDLASSHVSHGPIHIEEKHTKMMKTEKPLTFLTPCTEFFNVNNTGKSIDLIRIKQHPVGLAGTVSGGILGQDSFEFATCRFSWSNVTSAGHHYPSTHHDKESIRLEATDLYFNRKYKSFEDALKHHDGIMQAVFTISVFDSVPPNYLFIPFGKILKKLKHPGDHHCAPASATYYWFIFYPKDTVYHTYRSTYTDQDTGKTYPATTLVVAPNNYNYLSTQQFEDTFGTLKDCAGHPISNDVQTSPPGDSPVLTSKGIVIINLPE